MRRIPPETKTAGIPSVAAATTCRTADACNVTGTVTRAPVAVFTGRYTVVWIDVAGMRILAVTERSTTAVPLNSVTGTCILPSSLPNLACVTTTGTEISSAPEATDSRTVSPLTVGTLITSSPLAVYIRTSPIVDCRETLGVRRAPEAMKVWRLLPTPVTPTVGVRSEPEAVNVLVREASVVMDSGAVTNAADVPNDVVCPVVELPKRTTAVVNAPDPVTSF